MAKAAVVAASALFATVKRKLTYADPETSPYQSSPPRTYIYSVWHDSLLIPLFLGRQPKTIALVGMHQDGAFLTHSLKALNISAVRGSSSRGGAESVSQLLASQPDHHLVVTPDGPRGPRRKMKSGVAYLASRTGRPVVPTAFACRRSWSIGSGWTDLIVPRPWTVIYAFAGNAIEVPAEANRGVLREFTEQIQDEMDRLNALAARIAAGTDAANGVRLKTEMSNSV